MMRANPFKTLVFTGLATLLFNFQAVAAPKDCSGGFFAGKCQDFSNRPLDLRKSTSEADGVVFNYFLIGSPAHFAEISNFNRSPNEELSRRALTIANQARDAAIAYVTANNPDGTWSEEVASIVQRLRTVEIRVSDSSASGCLAQADPGIPNAVYTRGRHTIDICPGQVKTTSQDIAAAISHELGHAVSPCVMKSPLIKYSEPKPEMGACLGKIGEGVDRSEQDRELFGEGPIPYKKPSEYGVEQDPVITDGFIRCKAAERLPESERLNPRIYRTISSCLEKRYAGDYETWLATDLFGLEKMPKRFDTLPARQAKEWPLALEARKSEVPLGCFRKLDEHFADSFGAHAYSEWIRKNDMTASQFELGLGFLTGVQCVQKINSRLSMKRFFYPEAADRIALYLKPKSVASLVGCQDVQSESLCSLNEQTYTVRSLGTAPPEHSGTKR